MGVPDAEAEAFWAVAKGNITVLADLEGWWTLFRDGAEPVVDEADRDFVRQALALLPAQPWTTATWGEWTQAVKDATGRKGKDLFRPLRRALTGRDAGPEMADVMPLSAQGAGGLSPLAGPGGFTPSGPTARIFSDR